MMAEQRLNCSAEQLLNCALTSSSATGTRSNDSGFLANCVPQEESRFQNEFKIVGELGEGGYGRVYQVANKTDRKGYAIKIVELPQNEDDHDKAVNEAQILSNLVHGNVVRYYGAWKEVWVRNGPALNKMTASDHTDENDSLSSIPNSARDNLVPCLFIQMELCPISLRQVIDDKKYKKDQLAQLFFELVQGVHYIHNQGYFHRDVNPNNIFIGHDKQVKIGDFGLARLHINAEDHDHVFSENVGTLLYQAPEMRTVKYDKSSDIYSLGIVFFEILYPMDTASERCNVLKKLRTSDITFPGDFLEHASPWHKMLLQSILNHVPDERPSLENILDQMSDNYTLQHTEFSKERALKSMFKAGNIESFSYDMLENIRIIPPQHNILRSIETIFRRYGADQLQVPLLTPRYSLEGDLTSAAELITKAGLSVCLPSSSRTNFARFILLNSIKSMKRYDTLRTFKEISGQFHPKQRYECVLDIVSSDPVLFKVDAQILQVLISLDNFINDLYKGKGHIRTAIAINHVDIVMSILLSVGVQLQDLKNVLNLIGTSGYQAIMTPGDHHINKEKLERILKLKGSPDFIERKVLQEVHEEFIPRVKNAFQHLKNTLDYLHETMCLFSPIIKINVDCCSNVQFCSGLLFSYSANNGTCLRDTVVADGGRYDNILDSLRSKWCLKTEEEIERWCGLTVYPWEIVLLVADFFPPEFVILTCHAVELEKKVHLLAQILRGRGFNCNIKWNLKAPEIEALKDDSSVLCLIEYHENSVKFFHKYSNVSKNGRFYWEKRCNPNPPSIIMPYDQFHQMVLRSFPKFPFKFQEDIFTVRREPATEPVVGFICSVAIARPPQNFFYVAD